MHIHPSLPLYSLLPTSRLTTLFFSFFDISFNPPQILQLQLAEIDRIEKVSPFDFPATFLKTIFTFTIQTLHDDATEEKLRFDALFKEELLSIIKAQAQDALLKEELLSIIKAQAQDREHREPILHWLEGQYGSTEIAPRFRESVPESAPESAGSSEDERFAESGNDLSERAAEKKRGQ